MSITDPAKDRVLRTQRAKGSLGALFATLIAGLICIGAGYLFSTGLAGIIGTFRWMAFENINSWSTSDPSFVFAFFGGLFGGQAAEAWYSRSINRYTGGGGIISSFALSSIGFAAGFWVTVQRWDPPEVLGFSDTYGDQEPWGAYAWIMYSAAIWMPVLAAIFSLTIAFLSLTNRTRSRRRTKQAEALLVVGTSVHGEVTEAVDTNIELHGLPLISFTVKFRDSLGKERWVTKKSTMNRAQVPRRGQSVTVIFDQQKLSEKDIAVVLEPLESVELKLREGKELGRI